MHPAGGQGAANAMQDAITLANVIASLPSKDEERNITKAFKEYKAERFPLAKSAYKLSQTLSKSFERVSNEPFLWAEEQRKKIGGVTKSL